MNKTEFILELNEKLSFLPAEEIKERISFYLEMIDDRIEEGLSEEEAVKAVGETDKITEQIISELPFTLQVKKKIKPKRRLNAWETAFLVLGSPIWVSLLISAFAIILSLYVSLWAIIISFWAVFISFVCGAVGGFAYGVILIFTGSQTPGTGIIAASIICAGLAIFAFYGCRAVTKGAVTLTGIIFRGKKAKAK